MYEFCCRGLTHAPIKNGLTDVSVEYFEVNRTISRVPVALSTAELLRVVRSCKLLLIQFGKVARSKNWKKRVVQAKYPLTWDHVPLRKTMKSQ